MTRAILKLFSKTHASFSRVLPSGKGCSTQKCWLRELGSQSRCVVASASALQTGYCIAFRAENDIETSRVDAEDERSHGKRNEDMVQVGGIEEGVNACRAYKPDVLVVQGIDAGGHGLNHGAGVISLLPEVSDALYGLVKLGELAEMPILIAAGGIAEGRGRSLLDIGSGRRCDGH